MPYDLDRVTDRSGSFSVKWDIAGDALPMWVADMDFQAPPEVIDAIKERAASGIYGYTLVPQEWRNACSSWWKKRHGLEIDPSWLIFAAGVVPAVSCIIRKLTKPGEKVLIQPPVYNAFYDCINNNGRTPLESPLILRESTAFGPGGCTMLEYDMDFADLEARMADPACTLMLLCNPQNPTGRIWTREELLKVGELAAANGVTVVSDEIHCDLCDPGFSYVPYASVSEACLKSSVTCLAPTKTFNLAGIMSSAVFAADQDLREKLANAIDTDGIGGAGCFAPIATIAAFEKGGPWLDELTAYIAENKRLLAEFLAKELPRARMSDGPATYLCWLDLTAFSEDDRPLQKHLKENAKLFLCAGSIYGDAGRGFMRINVACPRSMLIEGMKRLKAGIESFRQEAKA